MNQEYVLKECKQVLSLDGKSTRELLNQLRKLLEGEIKRRDQEFKDALKESEQPRHLKALYKDETHQIYRCKSLLKDIAEKLHGVLIWSDDPKDLKKKFSLLEDHLIPSAEIARYLCPRLILTSNQLLKGLVKMKIALQGIP